MTDTTAMNETSARRNWRQWRRPALIITGLIMFAFMTSHMINLMLGFHSIWLMDEWRWALSGIWSGPVTGRILTLALLIHFGLALALFGVLSKLLTAPWGQFEGKSEFQILFVVASVGWAIPGLIVAIVGYVLLRKRASEDGNG